MEMLFKNWKMENVNGKNPGLNSSQNREVIDWALRQKGEGSIKRIWERYRKAKLEGNDSLATALARIARSKFAYARDMKKQDSSFFGKVKKALNDTLGI